MNLVPSSITLANLLGVLCRLMSCDVEYQAPVSRFAVRRNQYLRSENGIGAIEPAPTVVTQGGSATGYYMQAIKGRAITAFEGIPYANASRFADPVPTSWKGVLHANNPGPLCMQLFNGRLRGSEDCLRLNVYTPSVKPLKPYPVIIFIHGGFWFSGSGAHFGPAYLLEHDVILVTFNYRLGSLGFFSLGNNHSPGNWGLKDQAFAIDWVYENIASFGGDPSRITLSGNSAGSVSTHLHMISNYSTKDKLNAAISLSGTAYNVWGLNSLNTARRVSLALAQVSRCPVTEDSEAIISCMRQIDASVLVANQLLTFQAGFFLPSIEPSTAPTALLTQTADEAYSSGKVARIPWIVSMTSRELSLPVSDITANAIVTFLRGAFNTDLPRLLSYRRQGVNEAELRRKIIEFYTNGSSVNELFRNDFIKIATDRYFTVGIHKAIQMHSQVAPTYASIFSYTSRVGRGGRRGFNPTEIGAIHGDDLVYFLNSTANHPPIRRNDPHFAITKLLVNLYGNFAQYGEPVYTGEDNKRYKIWDVVDNPESVRFLNIDEEVKMIEDPYKCISKFWEDLGIPGTTSYFSL